MNTRVLIQDIAYGQSRLLKVAVSLPVDEHGVFTTLRAMRALWQMEIY